MTVAKLIEVLKKMNPDEEVLFSSDEEGNVLHRKATVELTEGFDEEDESKTAVVIYPLNSDDDIS